MRGWILFKHSQAEMPSHIYEIPRLIEVAAAQGIEIEVVKPEQFELIVTRDDRKSILLDGKVTPLPDFLLPRMGAGTTYFALAIIRHLERLGVAVLNKSASVEIVRDKLYTQQVLAASNLPVPKTMFGKFPVDVDLVEKTLGFPVVVKTLIGSQGSGVYLSEDRKNFADMIEFLESSKPGANMILQEFIASSRGRDLRVFVIGGRVVACMQRSAMDGGFKANVAQGGSTVQFPMTPEIEMLALEATRILDLDIAGVDLLFDEGHFKICEVNSAPHFKGLESCHPDLNIAEEIYRYVRARLGRFDEVNSPIREENIVEPPVPDSPLN